MKRPNLLLLAVAAVTCIGDIGLMKPEGTWTSVRSRHFLLVGNAPEGEIVRQAVMLEQFRGVFERLFPTAALGSPGPTTAVIFKDRLQFRPFQPLLDGKVADVDGYFQRGWDVNYIALTGGPANPDVIPAILHEYVHALTAEVSRRLPLWLNEGLAEYYSRFSLLEKERKARLGASIDHHLRLLKGGNFLPLERLFAVNHQSSDYSEDKKASLFYAESWALTHYLLQGDSGRRHGQLTRYLEMLANGRDPAGGFVDAFQTDFPSMEKELSVYILSNLSQVDVPIPDGVERTAEEIVKRPLSGAEAEFYLGDLLFHTDRPEEASVYLRRAIARDPGLIPAYESLGILLEREGRFSEAKGYLEKAIAGNGSNPLAYYSYALALIRGDPGRRQLVATLKPATARAILRSLRRSIELAPSFTDAYWRYAVVCLVSGEDLVEGIRLMTKAAELAPENEDYALMLGQLRVRNQEFNLARTLLESIARSARESRLRIRAREMLVQLDRLTSELARAKALGDLSPPIFWSVFEEELKSLSPAEPEPCKPFAGEMVAGKLTRIECADGGLIVHIASEGRTLRLYAEDAQRIKFLACNSASNEAVDCKKFDPAPAVVAFYRKAAAIRPKYDGEALAVEFVGK